MSNDHRDVDDEKSLADLEKEQARIAEEVKRRRRAALKAQREAEQQQLIAAGEGQSAAALTWIA